MGDELRPPGVVDQPVDAPPFVHGRLRHGAAILILRDVALKQESLHPLRGAGGFRLFRFFQAFRVVDNDIIALVREGEGDGSPGPCRGAGDDGNFIG